jgi:hypothetical protein
MPTANLLNNTAFPVHTLLTKQHRFSSSCNDNDTVTGIQPALQFSIPPFVFKINATAREVASFKLYNTDNTLYNLLNINLIRRARQEEDGILYDYFFHDGGLLHIGDYIPIDTPCGTYYASVTIGDEEFFTEPFVVKNAYNVDETNIVTNGSPIASLYGWVTPGYVAFANDGRIDIASNNTTSVILFQNLTPLPAPWLYTIEVAYETYIGELNMEIINNGAVSLSQILSGAGLFTGIVENPEQIRFSWDTAGAFNSGSILSVKIKKILNVACYNRLVWGDTCSKAGIPYNVIIAGTEYLFSQSVHFTAEVAPPEHTHTIEDAINELSVRVKKYESVEKHVLAKAAPIPGYLVNALQLVPLHSDIVLVQEDGVEVYADYVTAEKAEWLFDAQCYATQTIDFISQTISDSNCCTIIDVECPEAIPTLSVVATKDEESGIYSAVFSISPTDGFQNAVFLMRTSTGTPPDCDGDFVDGQEYTLQQILDGEANYSTPIDGNKYCTYLYISLPGCTDIDGNNTNTGSFSAL